MLVITRRVGEVLWIGNARVVVIRVGNGRVRLGVAAPTDVGILRGELSSSSVASKIADSSLVRQQAEEEALTS